MAGFPSFRRAAAAIAGSLLVASIAVAQSPKPADRSEPSSPLYLGRTLDQWRDRIGHLDLRGQVADDDIEGLRLIIVDRTAPWFTRRQAALTLGRIGAPASRVIPDLAALLNEPSESVETSAPLWALKALALFGSEALNVTPQVAQIFTDATKPYLVRLTATETLGRIGAAHSLAISTLISAVHTVPDGFEESEELEVRVAVIEALELAAPPSALPALVNACEDEAERVRRAAATTIGSLGSQGDPAIEMLASLLLFDESVSVREAASRALARIGDHAIPALLQLMQDDDEDVQLLAIDAFRRLGPAARDQASPLALLFDDASADVAMAAIRAHCEITAAPEPVLPRLVTALSHENREIRKMAADLLMKLGLQAAPARPALERLARDGSDAAQTAAQRVLEHLSALESSEDVAADASP